MLLGAVRRRDLLCIANARALLDGLGRRPPPAEASDGEELVEELQH